MPVISLTNVEDVTRQLTGDLPLVVVPVYNAFSDVMACVESILRNTEPEVPVLVVDDAGGDARAFELIHSSSMIGERTVLILHHERNSGFVGSCNDAFRAADRRDVVLVNSDVIVGPQWLERLREAAKSSSTVATASSLTNHGTLLSVPEIFRPSPQLPPGHTPDSAAEAVARWSTKSRPSIPTAVGHCVYINRNALDLAGGFDEIFGRGYGEEVDFSQRCVSLGLRHVCADDVFTYHRGGGSFGSELTTQQAENEKIVNGRHPWYPSWVRAVETDRFSPLLASLVRASVALRGMSIAIDGRALGPDLMGTQQVIIETVRSLVDHELVAKVVVYTSGPVPEYARVRLADPRIRFVTAANEHSQVEEVCDVAYRPYQAWGEGDVAFLRQIGRWTAINQLDCIAFGNPAYFPNSRDWLIYRATTRAALSGVDGVSYLSQASMDAARAEGLVPRGAAEKVVYTGAQFDAIETSEPPRRLKGVEGPFVFVLGVAYLHKNRPFAMEILQEARRRGWNGKLVLAGLVPPAGGSLGHEASMFLDDPSLRNSVIVLPALSEPEKRWMFENSELMLYPTTVEGFGLVPFEAAMYGLATLSTRQGSLDEVLPQDVPTISGFDVSEATDKFMAMVSDVDLRTHVVTALRDAGESFTAERTTNLLMELFIDMMRQPPTRVAAVLAEDSLVPAWHASLVSSRVAERVVPPGVLVRLGWKMRSVKSLVSPDGSRRQAWIRRRANRLRALIRK